MNIDDATDYYGNVATVANVCGVTPPTVYKWVSGIPTPYQALLQLRTGGKLMADPEVREVVKAQGRARRSKVA